MRGPPSALCKEEVFNDGGREGEHLLSGVLGESPLADIFPPNSQISSSLRLTVRIRANPPDIPDRVSIPEHHSSSLPYTQAHKHTCDSSRSRCSSASTTSGASGRCKPRLLIFDHPPAHVWACTPGQARARTEPLPSNIPLVSTYILEASMCVCVCVCTCVRVCVRACVCVYVVPLRESGAQLWMFKVYLGRDSAFAGEDVRRLLHKVRCRRRRRRRLRRRCPRRLLHRSLTFYAPPA